MSNRKLNGSKAFSQPIPADPSKVIRGRTSWSYFSSSIFVTVFASRLLAAIYAPIQDCDEVFNFWEPTHYLNHGFGMQTWELSPVYAIRSWLYISLHAGPIALFARMTLSPGPRKSTEFYFLRVLLAFACAGSESKLYNAVSRHLNSRIAILCTIISVASTGMFHASTAYLPSSFAMYTVSLALGYFLEAGDGDWINMGLLWLSIGTIAGWPFVAALSLPLLVDEVIANFRVQNYQTFARRILTTAILSVTVLLLEICVDSLFFKRLKSVPINIVLYNVFGGAKKGPNIFGVEPWHFYIRNLVLNFQLWFVLSISAIPLCFIFRKNTESLAKHIGFSRLIGILSPMYLWLLIFTLQPHKEERFLYPIYPCIVLNASVSVHFILLFFRSAQPSHPGTTSSGQVKFIVVGAFIAGGGLLGILRSIGMVTAYSAPLHVYEPLYENSISTSSEPSHICLGKEWYRYPSSYHIPQDSRLKFIKSEFHGLLPGAFVEDQQLSNSPFSIPSGAFTEPYGMNDENIEDPSKYSNISECDYLIDLSLQHSATEIELDFASDQKTWERVKCVPFLDSGRTGLFGRLFWVPEALPLPNAFRRKWGQYCLLKRRKLAM